MSTDNFFLNLEAYAREHTGRAYNKKLRYNNNLTASIETIDNKIILLSVEQKHTTCLVKRSKHTTAIIRLFLSGKRYFVVIKDLQVHSYKPGITNIVFKEVVPTKKVLVDVPIIITGEKNCVALQEGCKLEKKIEKISLCCSVQSIPRCLNINVKCLKGGDIVYFSDIPYLKTFGIVASNIEKKLVLKITKQRDTVAKEAVTNNLITTAT